MAIVKLKVSSNMVEAAKDIKNFGKITVEEFKRMQQAQKKFSSEELQAFSEKTRRAGIAVHAVKGKMAGLKEETFRLQRKMQTAISDGIDPLNKDLQKLSRRVEENKRVMEAHAKAVKVSEDAMEAAKVAAIALAVALAAATAFGTKSQANYAKEIANVNTLIEISEEQFKALDASIEHLSNTYAVQKKALGTGVYQAVSAGAETLNEALIIVNASAKLGKAALIENAQSVDIITTAMNAYSKEVVSANKASNIFFQTIKKGKITGEQLSATIGQSIPLFSSMGISLEELGAGIATMTKLGVKSSEATTQLNATVRAFLKPSEAMTAALKRQGIESGSLLLRQRGLAGAMEVLEEATGGSTDMLAELLPNIRAIRGALALGAQEGEIFAEVLQTFNDVSGVTDKALRRQTDGYAKNVFTVEQAIIALTNLSMSIGEVLLPMLGKVAEAITSLTTDFGEFSAAGEALKITLIGIGFAITPMLTMAAIPPIIKNTTKAWAALNVIMKASPLHMSALGWLAVATAVGAVTVAISANIAKSAEASGAFAAMGNEGLAKVSGKLERYQFLMSKGKDANKAMRKEAKALKKELENLTGSTIRLIDVSENDGTVTKRAIIQKHGYSQTVFSLNKRVATNILLSERAAVALAELAAAEKAADEDAAEAIKKKIEAILAKEKAEAEAQAKWKAGIASAKNIREQAFIDASQVSMSASEKEIDNINREFAEKSKIIRAYYVGDTAALKALKAARDAELAGVKEEETDNAKVLREKLRVLSDVEKQAQVERTVEYEKFLSMRVAQEGVDASGKVKFLREQLERVLALETLTDNEKIAAKKATAAVIKEIEAKNYEERLQLQLQWIESAFAIAQSSVDMLNGLFTAKSDKRIAEIDAVAERESEAISSVADEEIKAVKDSLKTQKEKSKAIEKIKEKEADALAKIEKKADDRKHKQALADWKRAILMIQVNTMLGMAKTWATIGYPGAIPLTIALGASSTAATAIAMANKPVPTAETGASFTVPEDRMANRVDGVGVKVSAGEHVEVTPRGEDPGRDVHSVLMLNDEVIWESMQRGVDENMVTFTSDNLRDVG